MKPYERLEEFTRLSSYGIFLVVFAHSYLLEVNGKPACPDFFRWLHDAIFSFHMPLFIFISGYLFIHTNRNKQIDYRNFITKKAKRLLVPYFILSAVAFFLKVWLSAYVIREIAGISFQAYIKGVAYPEDNPVMLFWFLPTLFLMFLVAPFFFRGMFSSKRTLFLLISTLIILFFNLRNPFYYIKIFGFNYATYYFVYFWTGCLFCLYRNKVAILGHSFVVLIITAAFLALNLTEYYSYYTRFTAALLGIFMSFYLIAMNHTKSWLSVFRFIDGYSYQIFLLSWFFGNFVRVLLVRILGLGFYPCFLFELAAGLILPVITAKLVSRYFPRLKIVIGM